ncbi:N-acetyltransferase family protein [Spirillospora sp. CA-294931]|uniref:GNAT family N-acetyltransferase n=1 Tax=Spirillospora sp. CA-294931 TaxID=3240042 RepID=UPI003D8F6DFB
MRIRTATRDDLPALLALITEGDGEVGPDHERAFASIDADPRNELLVLDDAGTVVGCLQATYIPGLGRRGAERVLLEAVRVRPDRRGAGLGRHLIVQALERARLRGCALAQLTSHKRRTEAHRFYTSLGFEPTHDGFKRALDPALGTSPHAGPAHGDRP